MTVVGWAQLAVRCRADGGHAVAGRLHVEGLPGGARRVASAAGAGSARRAAAPCGSRRATSRTGRAYARAVLIFSLAAAGWCSTQCFELRAPSRGRRVAGPWTLSFNTASSFVSNTSWGMTRARPRRGTGRHHRRQLHLRCGGNGGRGGLHRGLARRETQARQRYSEALYAYLSQANNNGSAFAGYTGFISAGAGGTLACTASRSQTSPVDRR